ncbi:MAG: MBL fold metallo-hydrolase, partial [Clostridiales bacterium]
NDPVGFRLKVSNKEIAIATDIGKMTRSILSSIEKTDILLLESNHDKDMLKLSKYPYKLKRRIMSDKGHLSNDMAGKVVAYLAEQGMTRFILGHLSEKSNFPELVYQTVKNILKEKEIKIEEDIDLTISERNRLGSIVTL